MSLDVRINKNIVANKPSELDRDDMIDFYEYYSNYINWASEDEEILSPEEWFDDNKNYIFSIYSSNITHNLGTMAKEAGLYEALWRPYRICIENIIQIDYDNITYEEENDIEDMWTVLASDIIYYIEQGLYELKSYKKLYKRFDSPNGWGVYDDFVPFVEEYLEALKANPDGIINVDR